MSAQEWEEWIRKNAENWAKLPDEVKDYAQAVMDAGVSTEELAALMKEATLGFSLDGATSEIMELVKQSDLAFEDIASSFQKHMQSAILRTIQTKLMGKGLEQWYDNFSKDMEDGILSENEAKARQEEYLKLVETANAAYKAALEATGIAIEDALNNDPTTSLSGAIKGASQESIDLLTGQTNAVRVNQVESIEILRNQLLHLASIDMKVGISNKHLESIDGKLDNNSSDPLRAEGIIY